MYIDYISMVYIKKGIKKNDSMKYLNMKKKYMKETVTHRQQSKLEINQFASKSIGKW